MTQYSGIRKRTDGRRRARASDEDAVGREDERRAAQGK